MDIFVMKVIVATAILMFCCCIWCCKQQTKRYEEGQVGHVIVGQPPVTQITPFTPPSGIVQPVSGVYLTRSIPEQLPPSYNEAMAMAPLPKTNEFYSKQSAYNSNL